MSDLPVPDPPDTPDESEASAAPVSQADAETLPPVATPPDPLMGKPPTAPPSAPQPPWWFWPLGFLAIFGIDTALVLALVAQHQNLTIAAGVPGTLTLAALWALGAFSDHMGPRA